VKTGEHGPPVVTNVVKLQRLKVLNRSRVLK